ncbi:MAG: addiction module antitoxin [Candidatus Hydrogenedentes bacterium]|nr:addiction module antitoxin [Candidatus Hydrogenedentota bacterium]
MNKKLTISIDEDVYAGLHQRIGRRRISHFIEMLVRPHVIDKELDQGYRELAEDEQDAAEALEWIEGTLGDVNDDER